MRLTKLRIDTLAGLERPIEVARFGPGLNVVLGPNASGKSSLIRALLAILYPAEQTGQIVDAQIELVAADGVVYRARRLGETVSWESGGAPVEPPNLPPRHLVGTYVLRLEDLLGSSEPAPQGKRGANRTERDQLDSHIARSLAKELTGGIDLKAVRRSIGAQAEKGQKLAGQLRDAAAVHAELRRARAELRREDAGLTAARAELAAVTAEASRKHVVADATALLEAVLELEANRGELGSYPQHLADLLGNEAEEFDKALSARSKRLRDLERLDELAVQADRRLEATGLPVTLSANAAELHQDLAESLVSVSERFSHKEREIAALRVRHSEALRRLGGPLPVGQPQPPATAPVPEARLDDATLEKIERLLEQRQTARAEVHEIRRQLDEVSRLIEPAEDDDSLLDVSAGVYRGGRPMDGMAAPLRSVRHDLVKWLREPLSEPRRPTWTLATALGLAVVIVAAAGAGVPGSWLAALAGVEAVWLAVIWLLIPPLASPLKLRIEADVKALQEATELTLPEEWNHGSIVDVVLDIDDEIARRETSKQESERFDKRLRQLTGDSQLAQKRVEALQAELETLRARFGFGVPSDIGLALWLQAAREVEATRAVLLSGQTEVVRLAEESANLVRRLESYLTANAGPEASNAPRTAGSSDVQLDPLEARSRCRELLRLTQSRDAVLAEQESLRRERERVEDELKSSSAIATSILARCRLPSAAGVALEAAQDDLRALVAKLPAWRTAQGRLQTKEATVGELRSRIAHDDELLAAALAHDRAALETAGTITDRAAERVQELTRAIHRTERDVERAGSERRLEQAATRVRAATDELLAHRQVAIELAAVEFMLDTVEAEHEAGTRPAALERASSWFSRFTDGAFELTFEPSGAGGGRTLGARDAGSDRRLQLGQLSSGTRAQLLLASRLAFALETEQWSAPLPFFLDEALTTSDEQRFRQVARAVLSVARDDRRQFIYLSARDDDADLWRQVASEHGSTIELIEDLNRVA